MIDWDVLLYSNSGQTPSLWGVERREVARACSRCDVRWSGGPVCWVCSKDADGSPRTLVIL